MELRVDAQAVGLRVDGFVAVDIERVPDLDGAYVRTRQALEAYTQTFGL